MDYSSVFVSLRPHKVSKRPSSSCLKGRGGVGEGVEWPMPTFFSQKALGGEYNLCNWQTLQTQSAIVAGGGPSCGGQIMLHVPVLPPRLLDLLLHGCEDGGTKGPSFGRCWRKVEVLVDPGALVGPAPARPPFHRLELHGSSVHFRWICCNCFVIVGTTVVVVAAPSAR